MVNASTRQIASVDRYANALFQLAKEAKVLETVSSELLNLKKILNEDDTLLSMVKNPSISKSNKFNFFNFRYINITALDNLLGSCRRVGVILFEYSGACKT